MIKMMINVIIMAATLHLSDKLLSVSSFRIWWCETIIYFYVSISPIWLSNIYLFVYTQNCNIKANIGAIYKIVKLSCISFSLKLGGKKYRYARHILSVKYIIPIETKPVIYRAGIIGPKIKQFITMMTIFEVL